MNDSEIKSVINIINGLEKLEQENQQLKEQLHEASLQIQEMIEQDIECPSNCSKIEDYKNNWNELWDYIMQEWYCFDNESVEYVVSNDILHKMQELEKGKSE